MKHSINVGTFGIRNCMCLDRLQPHIRQSAESLVHQSSASACHFNVCISLFWFTILSGETLLSSANLSKFYSFSLNIYDFPRSSENVWCPRPQRSPSSSTLLPQLEKGQTLGGGPTTSLYVTSSAHGIKS